MPEPTIHEQTTANEFEAAVYQSSMRAHWAFEDYFYRHMAECVDAECQVCNPTEGSPN